MKRFRKFLFLSVFLFSSWLLIAQPVKTVNGIIIPSAGKYIEMSVVNNSVFCLSFNSSGNSAEIKSAFIAEKDGNTKNHFSIVSKGSVVGLKTGFGKLLFDTQKQTWTLSDNKGKVLFSNATLSWGDSVQKISYTLPQKSLFYGSGNYSTKNLLKSQSAGKQGNGTDDIPYCWTTVGFCTFGTTGNDNRPATWKAVENSSVDWTFSGKTGNLYIWPASNLYEATNNLIAITGKAKIPPRWAFGFLQSQWGWADRAYIENAIDNFRSRKLPVDAFIYDFEWYTTFPDYFVKENGIKGFSDFSFNEKLFPEPQKQIAEYKKNGIKFIGIRKPRLGDSLKLIEARKNGWILKSDYNNRDLDFSNPGLVKWYKSQTRPLLEAGVDAWWNDEGESYYTCYYYWNKTESELLNEVFPNTRFFSINRSFSPGNQRLGYCTWNGDIRSTWKALQETPADLLNYSLSGMFYGSCDIGGFGEKDPSKELVVRWYEAGVFLPVMRAHSNLFTRPRFPWLWGDDAEAAIRKSLNLRYQLIPYFYSVAHEAYQKNKPIMRPLIMEFPNDTALLNLTDEWLVGKDLLAAPILNEGGNRNVYLPDDKWYDFQTNQLITGPCKLAVSKALDEIPVYVRAGAILPIGPIVQHTEQDTTSVIEVHVYPGKNGSFCLTEDDGKSYDYVSGKVRNTVFEWNDATKTLSWKATGNFAGKYKSIKAVLFEVAKTASLSERGKIKF
jgi:alpha-glucosidase